MASTNPLVWDALYENTTTGKKFKFLGLKNKTVVLQNPTDNTWFEITRQDFNNNYKDTGIHNHETACCDVHRTHTTPHTGCLLR